MSLACIILWIFTPLWNKWYYFLKKTRLRESARLKTSFSDLKQEDFSLLPFLHTAYMSKQSFKRPGVLNVIRSLIYSTDTHSPSIYLCMHYIYSYDFQVINAFLNLTLSEINISNNIKKEKSKLSFFPLRIIKTEAMPI